MMVTFKSSLSFSVTELEKFENYLGVTNILNLWVCFQLKDDWRLIYGKRYTLVGMDMEWGLVFGCAFGSTDIVVTGIMIDILCSRGSR